MQTETREAEYEKIREEMTARFLWIYGLIPASLTIITGLVTWILDPSSPKIPLVHGILVLLVVPLVCCFITYEFLCANYDSGSYLIVYHELDSKYQYHLRSRFLARFVKQATNSSKGKGAIPWGITIPSIVMYYLLLTIGSIAIITPGKVTTLRFDAETVVVGAVGLVLILALVLLLIKLIRLRSVMERNLLEYKESKEVKDVSFIFEELAQKHCTPKGRSKKKYK
jgi:hypothetical protein